MVEMAIQRVVAASATPGVQRRGAHHGQQPGPVHGQRSESQRIGVYARQHAQGDAPDRRQHHIHTPHHAIRHPLGRRGDVVTRLHRGGDYATEAETSSGCE
jgi:hypothetical protein